MVWGFHSIYSIADPFCHSCFLMPFRQLVAVLHCNSAIILDCTAGSSDWSSIAFSMAHWSDPPLAGGELEVRSALVHQCRGRLWSCHNAVTSRRYRRQQRTRLYKEEKYNSCFVYNCLRIGWLARSASLATYSSSRCFAAFFSLRGSCSLCCVINYC